MTLKLLVDGALYKTSDVDRGITTPPFNEYLFIVLETWYHDDDYHVAKVLMIEGNDMFPPGTVHRISPIYWLWSEARRIA